MSEDAERTKTLRRTYGRGRRDALQLLGIDMNDARIKIKEMALNGMAKKVLACIPAGGEWSGITTIMDRMRKVSGNPDFKVVRGCLSALREADLIREEGTKERPVFTRTTFSAPARPEPASAPAAVPEPVAAPPSAAQAPQNATEPEGDKAINNTVAIVAMMQELSSYVQAELARITRLVEDTALIQEECHHAALARLAAYDQLREAIKKVQI